jgi:sec-independent protein translocase protein TatC
MASHPSDGETEEMLRMTFLEHLSELRARIIKALLGFAAAFAVSLTFTYPLWTFVSTPAAQALRSLGYPEELYVFDPMDAFQIIYVKLPIVCAIFLASPWVLYQVWAFIAPGLYRHERRWAGPVLIGSSGLFISGGVFAYFFAFRYGLTFLLGIAKLQGLRTAVPIDVYFQLFVNVVLSVGVIFELPVVVFLLTALRVVTPGFLMRQSRYAILAIFILAAIITPSTDVFNLVLFAAPMCVLYYLGVLASYLFTLRRDGQPFPWRGLLIVAGGALAAGGGAWAFVEYRRRSREARHKR